jgi:hypothetical protein
MSYQQLKMSLHPCVLFMMLWSYSLMSFGQTLHNLPHPYLSLPYNSGGNGSSGGNSSDEDTILVEQEQRFKISYSRLLKVVCKQLFNIDIDDSSKNKRHDVIRQLDDLYERTHYSLRLKQDEITLKFSLSL